MNTTTCFAPAHILLPAEQIPLKQWGCIACDQFTSDREYWQRAKEAADGSPSTLNLILPEVYLEDGDADARVEQIHATMADYAQNVLTRAVDGFVYVERTEQSGRVRQGLVGMVDLEAYSYRRGEKCTVRPSESTVESRIPPRMKVRTGASLETPHIMMLADDPGCTLIEPVAAHKQELPKVYEGELLLNGGHIAGWAVEDPALIAQIEDALAVLGSQEEFDKKYPDATRRDPLTLAVGDGNHSLATAKACWEELKKTLTPEQAAVHPAPHEGAHRCRTGNAPHHDAGRRPSVHPHRAHRGPQERAAQSVRGRTDAGRRPCGRLGRGGPGHDRPDRDGTGCAGQSGGL